MTSLTDPLQFAPWWGMALAVEPLAKAPGFSTSAIAWQEGDFAWVKHALENGETLPLDPQFLSLLQILASGGNTLPALGNVLPQPPTGDPLPAAPSEGLAQQPTSAVALLQVSADAMPPKAGAQVAPSNLTLEFSRDAVRAVEASASEAAVVSGRTPGELRQLQAQRSVADAALLSKAAVLPEPEVPPSPLLGGQVPRGDVVMVPAFVAVNAQWAPKRLDEPTTQPSPAGLLAPVPLSGASSAPASAPALELQLSPRVGDGQWAQALGEKVLLLAGRDQQVAELRLNPPHLGPLEVRVALHSEQASVAFVAQHAPVREALEQAIPRLREMFEQQDLQLLQVDVSQRDASEQSAGKESGSTRHAATAWPTEGGATEESAPGPAVATEVGLVDLFA